MQRVSNILPSNFRVSLAIVEFSYKHVELTRFLGFEPSRIYVKCEKTHTRQRAQINGWFYEPTSKRMDLNSRLSLILKNKKLFKLKTSKFKKCQIVIQCMLDLNGASDPQINISEKNLVLLAKLGATFDLDYYRQAK